MSANQLNSVGWMMVQSLLLMLPHRWAMFVNFYISVNGLHNGPNSTWHVAGNLMGCELSPLLSRPLCDRVFTSLSARWICS